MNSFKLNPNQTLYYTYHPESDNLAIRLQPELGKVNSTTIAELPHVQVSRDVRSHAVVALNISGVQQLILQQVIKTIFEQAAPYLADTGESKKTTVSDSTKTRRNETSATSSVADSSPEEEKKAKSTKAKPKRKRKPRRKPKSDVTESEKEVTTNSAESESKPAKPKRQRRTKATKTSKNEPAKESKSINVEPTPSAQVEPAPSSTEKEENTDSPATETKETSTQEVQTKDTNNTSPQAVSETNAPEASDTPAPEANEAAEASDAPAPEANEAAETSDAPAPEANEAAEASDAPALEANEATETSDAPALEANEAAETSDTPASEADEAAKASDAPAPETSDVTEASDVPAPEANEAAEASDTPAPEADEAAEVSDTPAPEADEAAETNDAPAPEASDATETSDAPAPEANEAAEASDAPAPEANEAAEASDTPAPEANEAAEASDTPAPEADEAAEVSDAPAPEANDATEVSDTPAPEANEATEASDAPAPEANEVTEASHAPAPEANEAAEVSDAPAPEADEAAEVSDAPALEADEAAEASDAPAPEVDEAAEASDAPAPEADETAEGAKVSRMEVESKAVSQDIETQGTKDVPSQAQEPKSEGLKDNLQDKKQKRPRRRRRKKTNLEGAESGESAAESDATKVGAVASQNNEVTEEQKNSSSRRKRRRKRKKKDDEVAETVNKDMEAKRNVEIVPTLSWEERIKTDPRRSYKTNPIPGLGAPEGFAFIEMDNLIGQALYALGFLEPTPIQAEAIPSALEGRDIIGLAQTGTGKTLSFVIPVLQRLLASERDGKLPRALIMTPTRELAVQIAEDAEFAGTHTDLLITTIYGGVGFKQQVSELREGTDIIVATPGRLLDHMKQRTLKLDDISILVLDEADRMLDMGFLPDIRSILRKLPNDHQTLLFSATMPSAIERLSSDFQHLPQVVEIARQLPPETISQYLYPVEKHLKVPLLVHILQKAEEMSSVLIFTETKSEAEVVGRRLERSNLKVALMHGDRKQRERERALQDLRTGAVRILVATNVAARGLDINDISHVINYDMPQSVDDYIHRIGRTARGDASGKAYTFVTAADEGMVNRIESTLKQELPREFAEGFNYDVPTPSWARPSVDEIIESLHKREGLAERFHRMIRRR